MHTDMHVETSLNTRHTDVSCDRSLAQHMHTRNDVPGGSYTDMHDDTNNCRDRHTTAMVDRYTV